MLIGSVFTMGWNRVQRKEPEGTGVIGRVSREPAHCITNPEES